MEKIKEIYNYLTSLYENAECELKFTTPYELLVAVILSAQCTDKRVNEVTKNLFIVANTPEKMIKLGQENLEKIIYSCGFYKNKAKNIIGMSQKLISDFNGEVPSKMEELITLDGVGRKTANVVISTAFNGEAIAVDTHVFRVSNRLGITKANNPLESEQQLMKIIPKDKWSDMHYKLVLFGRYNCKSRNPNCETCKLNHICNYYVNNKSKS